MPWYGNGRTKGIRNAPRTALQMVSLLIYYKVASGFTTATPKGPKVPKREKKNQPAEFLKISITNTRVCNLNTSGTSSYLLILSSIL